MRSDSLSIDNPFGASPRIIKWAKIFKAKTLAELEKLAGQEEIFKKMVVELKKLSDDERIRQQMAARADYESRIATARGAGIKEGSFTMLVNLVNKGLLTVDAASKEANMTEEQFLKFLQDFYHIKQN